MNFVSAAGDVFSSESTYINCMLFAGLLGFAATGEWVAERSGTLNISVEAMLLNGAFAGAVGYHLFDWVGVAMCFGALGGWFIAFLQAQMSHRLTADQFVVGLTLNILVLGLTGFLDREIQPKAAFAARLEIPLLAELPWVGQALFGAPWPFYLLYGLVPLAWWLVFRTRWGLELRAAGENPQSADVSGVEVNLRRRQGIYFAGIASGLGGAYFLVTRLADFDSSAIGGRGFIAIAAVVFGGWTLWGTMAGCVLFAGALSFQLSLQGLGYEFNTELLQALPFLVTIGAMAVFARRVRAPVALAQPFIRGLK